MSTTTTTLNYCANNTSPVNPQPEMQPKTPSPSILSTFNQLLKPSFLPPPTSSKTSQLSPSNLKSKTISMLAPLHHKVNHQQLLPKLVPNIHQTMMNLKYDKSHYLMNSTQKQASTVRFTMDSELMLISTLKKQELKFNIIKCNLHPSLPIKKYFYKIHQRVTKNYFPIKPSLNKIGHTLLKPQE
eukprot:Phypoly_transcript_02849.p1 GENE.Phypoly_transcript_02849~~Phypoly_transcript_02849.p1  ORF type:complete len:185 (+),score=19.61 Phypoly_transcript_02849:2071-2625(+)